MKFCDKLLLLRKRHGYSQEQLADLLGISRQSVSKWESGQAMPELIKMIQISDLFSVPIDDLVRDERELSQKTADHYENTSRAGSTEPGAEGGVSDEELRQNLEEMKDTIHEISKSVGVPACFEYKSRISIGGIPLIHIHFSKVIFRIGVFPYNRTRVAKGIFAAGDMAVGVVSFGVFSIGVIPIGMLSIGLFAVGMVAIGVIAFGLSAIGIYAIGGAALGLRAAAGVSVSARTAVGTDEAKGLFQMLTGREHKDFSAIQEFLLSHTPEMPRWLARFMALFG